MGIDGSDDPAGALPFHFATCVASTSPTTLKLPPISRGLKPHGYHQSIATR